MPLYDPYPHRVLPFALVPILHPNMNPTSLVSVPPSDQALIVSSSGTTAKGMSTLTNAGGHSDRTSALFFAQPQSGSLVPYWKEDSEGGYEPVGNFHFRMKFVHDTPDGVYRAEVPLQARSAENNDETLQARAIMMRMVELRLINSSFSVQLPLLNGAAAQKANDWKWEDVEIHFKMVWPTEEEITFGKQFKSVGEFEKGYETYLRREEADRWLEW